MTLIDSFKEVFPKNTVLFIDDHISNIISLESSYSKLIPSTFSLICSIEKSPDEIREMIEKIMTFINFEYFGIVIYSSVEIFVDQIRTISGFDDYKLLNIISYKKQIADGLGYKFLDIMKPLTPAVVPILPFFSLLEFLPSTLEAQLFNDESIDLNRVAEGIKHVLNNNQVSSFKLNYLGTFSSDVSSMLEEFNNFDSSNAVLIIDRSVFPSPLFTETDSILDHAVRAHKYSLLKEKAFISIEINDGSDALKTFICNEMQLNKPTKTFESLFTQWDKLSEEKKESLGKGMPILKYLFDNGSYRIRKQLQDTLTSGLPLDEIIGTLSYCDSLLLIGYYQCVNGSIGYDKVQRIIETVYKNDKSDKSQIRSPEEVSLAYSTCFAGGKGKKFPNDELPLSIRSAFDQQADDDPRVKQPGSNFLGSIFGRQKSGKLIKHCDNVYVFVLGGISFSELKTINTLLMQSKKKKKFHIYSECFINTETVFKL